MVILVDTFIAACRVWHENVEIDFLSFLCIPGPSEWDGLVEIQKMPSSAAREEGSCGHFQDALQPDRAELPFNLYFGRKDHLHCLCVFSSLIIVNPPSQFQPI